MLTIPWTQKEGWAAPKIVPCTSPAAVVPHSPPPSEHPLTTGTRRDRRAAQPRPQLHRLPLRAVPLRGAQGVPRRERQGHDVPPGHEHEAHEPERAADRAAGTPLSRTLFCGRLVTLGAARHDRRLTATRCSSSSSSSSGSTSTGSRRRRATASTSAPCSVRRPHPRAL